MYLNNISNSHLNDIYVLHTNQTSNNDIGFNTHSRSINTLHNNLFLFGVTDGSCNMEGTISFLITAQFPTESNTLLQNNSVLTKDKNRQ